MNRPPWREVVLVAGLAAVGLLGTAGADRLSDVDVPIDMLGYALVVATAAGLLMRRGWPVLTLAVGAASTSTYLLIGYPYGPILLSFFVAVYSVARHRPLRVAVPAAAVALVALLMHLRTHASALPKLMGLAPGSAWVVVPFAIGVSVRQFRESAARLQAEAVRRNVDEERLRVAQEVHDVVGHGLAAINSRPTSRCTCWRRTLTRPKSPSTRSVASARRRSVSYAPPWPSFAGRARTRRAGRPLGWPGSSSCAARSAPPASGCTLRRPAPAARFRRAWSWPGIEWCKSR